MLHPNLIDSIAQITRRTMVDQGAGHGWDHIERVRRHALTLHEHEGGDHALIEIASLLHDVGDAKFNNGVEKSGLLTREILSEYDIPSSFVERVVHIVDNLSFRKRDTAEPLSHEGKIVQDADRLDALGAIGIIRTVEYGQFKSQPFFDPNHPSSPSGVMHFREKLFKLQKLMNTVTAKRIAEDRVQFMQCFLKQYFQEIDATEPTWLAADGRQK